MTRAVFNTTCDIYAGPGSATPGAFVGSFACRLVSNAAILLVGANAPTRLWYLTIQAYTPVGVWAAPLLSLDESLADLVAVPSGTDPRFLVLFTEQIDWQGQAVYQRANLVELPEGFWVGYGLVLGSEDELLDVGLVAGPIDEEEEEIPSGGGSSCEDADEIVIDHEYESVIPAGAVRYWRYPLATGLGYTLEVTSGPGGGSVMTAYGGDQCAGNTEVSISGPGTYNVPGGSHVGPYVELWVSASPFGGDVTFEWKMTL